MCVICVLFHILAIKPTSFVLNKMYAIANSHNMKLRTYYTHEICSKCNGLERLFVKTKIECLE